jgi:hypothetical protein
MNYEAKYLKYKAKYMQLKKELETHGGAFGMLKGLFKDDKYAYFTSQYLFKKLVKPENLERDTFKVKTAPGLDSIEEILSTNAFKVKFNDTKVHLVVSTMDVLKGQSFNLDKPYDGSQAMNREVLRRIEEEVKKSKELQKGHLISVSTVVVIKLNPGFKSNEFVEFKKLVNKNTSVLESIERYKSLIENNNEKMKLPKRRALNKSNSKNDDMVIQKLTQENNMLEGRIKQMEQVLKNNGSINKFL